MKAEVTTTSDKTQTTTKELEDDGRNCTNGHEVGQPLTLDLICNVHTNVTRVTEVQTNSVRGNNCEDNLVLKSGVNTKTFTGTPQEEFELQSTTIIDQSISHTDSQGLNMQLKEIDTDLEKIDISKVTKLIPNKLKSRAFNSTALHHNLSEAHDSQQTARVSPSFFVKL